MNLNEILIKLSLKDEFSNKNILQFACANKNSKIIKILGFDQQKYSQAVSEDLENFYAKLKQLDCKIVTVLDKNYPLLLREVIDRPAVLYCRGNLDLLQHEKTVSIVGSRRPSAYGLIQTGKIASELAKSGVAIVSGLALGIDAAAHRGALLSKGKTIAVLGTAIDNLYPQSNNALAKQILRDEGLVISEYPPGAPTQIYNFPIRNRIIAGLSKITIVTEAAERSGSLITAYLALDYNREVFALPGDINRSNSAGTNNLIKQGAGVFLNNDEILEILGLNKTNKTVDLTKEEQKVINLIDRQINEFDKILLSTNWEASNLNIILMNLELKGLVKQDGNSRFIVK